MFDNWRGALATAALLMILTPGAAPAAERHEGGIAVSDPDSSQDIAYPRLTRFPDPKVMAQVNAALAAQETSDRGDKRDCYAQIRDQKQTPDDDSYNEDIKVSYLSRRFFGVNVVTSLDCATAYPTNGAEVPMTFDLTTGTPVDWTTMFKPGFLPPANADADAHAPPSALTRLYRARYRPGADKDDDCRQVVTDDDPFASAPIFWLDAKRGLVVQPDFPHVIAACADDMALSAADIAPYLKNPALAVDLRQAVGR